MCKVRNAYNKYNFSINFKIEVLFVTSIACVCCQINQGGKIKMTPLVTENFTGGGY
jgi:hypothetical protein